MQERFPFLLAIFTMCSTARPSGSNMNKAAIGLAYGVLLHQRNMHFSAVQRMATLLAVKGGADDMLLRRLNKLGVTLHSSGKIRLLDECVANASKGMIEAIRQNAKVKITGDNLDLYIRTGNLSSEKRNRDLHLFTSNVIIGRVPVGHLSNSQPTVSIDSLEPDMFMLSAREQQLLTDSYSIILGRIFAKHLPDVFQWMSEILPDHIPHAHSDHTAQKSKVFTLPLMQKNEAKYEDCLDILDEYEQQVISVFTQAFGADRGLEILSANPAILGGDQLTRERLARMLVLRGHAPDAQGRFAHLLTVMCEMWHNKVDLTEKAYKALYKKEYETDHGTLNYFKVILRQTNVNGKVKSNFKAHWNLLIRVGELYLCRQVLDHLGIEDSASPFPQGICTRSKAEKIAAVKEITGGLIRKYGFGKFTLDQDPVEPVQMPAVPEAPVNQDMVCYIAVAEHSSGKIILVPAVVKPKLQVQEKKKPRPEDQFNNYATLLCHWVLHLIQVHDTAKEADMDRLIVNCKYNLMYFFGHDARSKYFIENLDFIMKTEYLLSPQMRQRALDGAFVNINGGKGQNVEADLVQEHSVRIRKELIRNLGANKTEPAMVRCTSAAETVDMIATLFDKVTGLKKPGNRHTHSVSETDTDKIKEVLKSARPFHYTPGRQCGCGTCTLPPHPSGRVDKDKMRRQMKKTIRRLAMGFDGSAEDEEQDETSEDEGEIFIGDDEDGDFL